MTRISVPGSATREAKGKGREESEPPRSHQGATKKPPQSHQGATKAPPRSHQRATQEPPRSHQGPTKEPPRRQPWCVYVALLAKSLMKFSFLGFPQSPILSLLHPPHACLHRVIRRRLTIESDQLGLPPPRLPKTTSMQR